MTPQGQMMRARVFVVAALLAGCYSPKLGSSDLQCAPDGSCPPGWSCIAGRCYAPNAAPDLASPATETGSDLGGVADLAIASDMVMLSPPDLYVAPMSYPPAAVWVSSGGGAAVAGGSGAELNVSIGGTIVAGDVTGSAGAQVTFSYFSNDIIQ